MFTLDAPYPTRMTHEELTASIGDSIQAFIFNAITESKELEAEFRELCRVPQVTLWYYLSAPVDVRWVMSVDDVQYKAESFPKLVEILRGIKYPLSTEPPIAKLDV